MTKNNGHTTNQVSHCPTCGSPCRVVGSPDFIGDDVDEMQVCTMHFEPISEKETWYLLEIGRLVEQLKACRRGLAASQGVVRSLQAMGSQISEHPAKAETGDKDETVHR